jgi:imidazolonepropionase-like amidohydrolase
MIIDYLKSDAGKAVHRAVADEYRQAITKLLGKDVDPAKAISIGPTRATATLRMMLAENVKLLFGTDTPSNEGFGNPPGLNGRLELARWVEAGVPLSSILRAATLDNAVAFGLSPDAVQSKWENERTCCCSNATRLKQATRTTRSRPCS